MKERKIYDTTKAVLSLAAGDRTQFAAIYEQYYLPIYHFAKKFVDNGTDAEDIAAEAFIKLWRQAEQSATISNVKAFLHVTAKNACLDHLKSQQTHASKESEIQFLASQDVRNAFELAEVKAEVLEYVYEAIERLPKKCKEVFKLSYLEGLKVPEVAEQLQISEQTVSNQKTRALKILRLALQDKHWVLLLWMIQHGRS